MVVEVGTEFDGMCIPFGAKALFWNNPDRADETSNEGVFLGLPHSAWFCVEST